MWRLLTGRVLRREGHTVKKTVRRAALLALLLGLLWVLSACGMDNSVEDLFTLSLIHI